MAAPAQRVVVPVPDDRKAIFMAADAALVAARRELAAAEVAGDADRVEDARKVLQDAQSLVEYLRRCEEGYARYPDVMPWQRVVMEIDAMPDVPTWKEIERQVDAAFETGMKSRSPSVYALHPRGVAFDWNRQLARLFPTVRAHLKKRGSAWSELVECAVPTWFAFRFTPNDRQAQLHTIAHRWITPYKPQTSTRYETDRYVLHRMSVVQMTHLLELLQQQEDDEQSGARWQQQGRARLRADLRAAIDRKTARVHLAQSGVIDMLAARQGNDVAQHIARLIAPDTVTLARPLIVRQHTLQLEQMRATMSAMDQPAAVLARATRQLKHRLADVSQETSAKKKQRRME